jgi:molecular chaperone GrpE
MDNEEPEAQPGDGSRPVEVEALQQELDACRTRSDEYLDGWQRARAEFLNYKKRIEREQSQVYQNAAGNVLKRFLDVADDLERALQHRPMEGDGAGWAEGIELIYRKLMNLLESEGVTRMHAEGQLFDPNLYEAVTSEDTDHFKSGHVIEVLQPGYMIGDRVLRPARVRVAR